MDTERVGKYIFGAVYPMYVTKVVKKGRSQEELDEVIRWLTGYSQNQLDDQIKLGKNFAEFFAEAPCLNVNRTLITGTVCGVRVEDIEDEFMRDVRYLDKLVDELAKGRPMAKILRQP